MAGQLTPGEEEAVRAYAAECRGRIPAFAARHFSLEGSLRLHRQALGLDLLRAPFNVLMVGPALFVRLAGVLARHLGLDDLGRWLGRRDLFIETRVSRCIADLVLDELLEMGDRPEAWRDRARHLIADYVAARHAVAEFAACLVLLAVGLFLLQALTPSAISLGPMLAQEMARREAIEGFWLGPWAGGLWYGWFPSAATGPELVATTLGVMVGFALLATFTGVLTDPLQQRPGLHERRLNRLITTLERAALGEDARLDLPDPYIARITDLADVLLIAMRLGR